MPLEPVSHLDDLVVTNPTDTDPVSEGDNHIRNLKIALAAGLTGDADETRMLAQGIARLLAVVTGADVVTDVDQALQVRLLNRDTEDVGLALELGATSGKGAIRETDGAGVAGPSWITLDPAEGVNLLFNDVIRLSTLAGGAEIKSFVDEAMSLTLANSIGGWLIPVQQATGQLIFIQTAAAGNIEANALIMNRDGAIQLFHANEFALDTADVADNNSGAIVHTDGNGTKPVGFNVLPRLDLEVGRALVNSDSGMMLRTNQIMTLSVPLVGPAEDFTCVILNSSPGTVTILATGGAQIRLYTGDGFADGTVFLNSGSVATITRAGTSTVFEIWGNGASQ